MGKLKVLLLETEELGRKSLIDQYQKVFFNAGFDSEIYLVDYNTGRAVDQTLKDVVYDVFITDLSFGRMDAYDGLAVIQKVKREFPNLFVIANSGKNITCKKASETIPSFDLFVAKHRIHDRKYVHYLSSVISSRICRNTDLVLDRDDCEFGRLLQKESKKHELEDLLRTITDTGVSRESTTSVARIILKPLHGGYSASEMYRLYGYTEGGLQCINAVLKLSDVNSAKEEIRNYDKYVKWYLPYSWRPELLGHSIGKSLGAICYSFVYNDDQPYSSLTELIQHNKLDSIKEVVRLVFGTGYQRWYHESNMRLEDNLTEYYYSRWFADRKDPEPSFVEWARQKGEVKENTVIIGSVEIPLPSAYLLARIRGTYFSCLRHGDLNSNNVLVSSDNYVSFIDFQETGRGHVFEDFVAFELSLRQHTNLKQNLEKSLGMEDDLCANKLVGVGRQIKYWGALINSIRDAAFNNFPKEKEDNYYYALSLGALRFFRWPIAEWQKDQMGALVVYLIKKLIDQDNAK